MIDENDLFKRFDEAHLRLHRAHDVLNEALVSRPVARDNLLRFVLGEVSKSLRDADDAFDKARNLTSDALGERAETIESELRQRMNQKDEAIKALQKRFNLAVSPDTLLPDEQEVALRGNKIEAIFLHRSRTGWGLKESKEAVERFLGAHSHEPSSGDDIPF